MDVYTIGDITPEEYREMKEQISRGRPRIVPAVPPTHDKQEEYWFRGSMLASERLACQVLQKLDPKAQLFAYGVAIEMALEQIEDIGLSGAIAEAPIELMRTVYDLRNLIYDYYCDRVSGEELTFNLETLGYRLDRATSFIINASGDPPSGAPPDFYLYMGHNGLYFAASSLVARVLQTIESPLDDPLPLEHTLRNLCLSFWSDYFLSVHVWYYSGTGAVRQPGHPEGHPGYEEPLLGIATGYRPFQDYLKVWWRRVTYSLGYDIEPLSEYTTVGNNRMSREDYEAFMDAPNSEVTIALEDLKDFIYGRLDNPNFLGAVSGSISFQLLLRRLLEQYTLEIVEAIFLVLINKDMLDLYTHSNLSPNVPRFVMLDRFKAAVSIAERYFEYMVNAAYERSPSLRVEKRIFFQERWNSTLLILNIHPDDRPLLDNVTNAMVDVARQTYAVLEHESRFGITRQVETLPLYLAIDYAARAWCAVERGTYIEEVPESCLIKYYNNLLDRFATVAASVFPLPRKQD